MVLLATDGSPASRRAEEVLCEYHPGGSDSVLIVHAIQQEPHPAATPEQKADFQTAQIERARDLLEEVEDRLTRRGYAVETTVEHGDAGPAICSLAEARGVDGIFMGRRGRGQTGEFLLGSVSQYVIHHADCPVTVVSPRSDS